MTSPTSEKTDAININTEGDVLEAMAKRQTTFLTPFESEKGRNKKSRSQQKTTKKSHTRCKSGMTKLSRRNNLNRSVIETNKHKAPNSIENRGKFCHKSLGPSNTSHSMNHGKIDKIIRENLKKQKEMELAKEIEELHIKEGMLLK